MSEHVRFGVPFNGVVPIWHDGTEITWHRPLDGTDLTEVLGLGHVATEPGPSPVPEGWVELVETGTLITPEGGGGVGPVLVLHPAAPSGRRAQASEGEGARIPLSGPLEIHQAMGEQVSDFDITGFTIHVARLMLRAARDRAILLFTLRAPRDPEAHHLLSVPSSVDGDGVMHFHLGTLLEMEAASWSQATRSEGMTLLDLDLPYSDLLADDAATAGGVGHAGGAGGPGGAAGAGEGAEAGGVGRALDAERLIEMAQPVVDAIVAPGYPFALGASFIVRTAA